MIRKVTASNLVSAIKQLDQHADFNYIHAATRTKIHLLGYGGAEGPIYFKRYDPSKGETIESKKKETISSEMLWRIANNIREGGLINFDRVLGGSYNTRSALEALLAHSPEFYFCYPGRIYVEGDIEKVEKGHKHLLWDPSNPHKLGVMEEKDTNVLISELPMEEIVYEDITLPNGIGDISDIDRRHLQIQVLLYFIGSCLGFRTWIASNDHNISYHNKKIGEYEGVIHSLDNEVLISQMPGAVQAAHLIDTIWFDNCRLMPAVIEVEHSTGVKPGLTRMEGFRRTIPGQMTRYVIVAPDNLRSLVFKFGNEEMYKKLNVRFFPYSAVEELYALCIRRNLKGHVTEEFLDCYMERVCTNHI